MQQATLPNPHALESVMRVGAVIELRDVGKIFTVNSRQLKVFERLSCAIDAGSFVSIVGPSGCGKSTLLKIISGLEAPTVGTVLFNGRLISGPPKAYDLHFPAIF